MFLFEVCANSVESAINAQTGGADRIELCANLESGGTTPSYASIKLCKEKLTIPINVLIRPRNGDFLYTDLEFQEIISDIILCKELGVSGIVCGFLNSNGTIDIERTKKIVELTYPLSFTFHRAFDVSRNPFESLEDIISCGATRILTSGTSDKAINATEILSKLILQANQRIVIMPGSGINENNIIELHSKTKAKEYHFSGSATHHSEMEFQKNNIISTEKSDYSKTVSDVEKIRNTINKLKIL
ncbi:MAG: copper homeostasis protein CutC [Bacteroidales bacterium]|jgi:copper homeostasis protein|nr:copper homeostasis protein CutC [Bacteroidales bacterium]